MTLANKMTVKVTPSSRIFSEQILKRFHDPLDCLTAHLMLECAGGALALADSNHPFFCDRLDNDYQYHSYTNGEHLST